MRRPTASRSTPPRGAFIHANDIRATGTHTGGPCGINDPIALISGATGTVSGNTIKDWRDIAITVSGTLTDVTIKKNTLLFEQLHGGILSGADGIWVGSDAKASVTANTVSSPASAGDTTPVLADGIDLHSPDPASLIKGNSVTNATVGVHATVASGVSIDGNTLKGGQVGIELSNADNATVTNNTTPGNLWGIDVSAISTGDSIHDNVFNGNTISDCTDDSTSAQTGAPHWGTANSWASDTGSVNVSPSHICAPGHG